MEYEIISKIASVWFFKNITEIKLKDTNLEFEFVHPKKANLMENWKILCAISDLANYGFSWNPHSCTTTIKKSTITTCKCQKTGTFSVLLINEPTMVRELLALRRLRLFLLLCPFVFSSTTTRINLNSTSFSLDVRFVYC